MKGSELVIETSKGFFSFGFFSKMFSSCLRAYDMFEELEVMNEKITRERLFSEPVASVGRCEAATLPG